MPGPQLRIGDRTAAPVDFNLVITSAADKPINGKPSKGLSALIQVASEMVARERPAAQKFFEYATNAVEMFGNVVRASFKPPSNQISGLVFANSSPSSSEAAEPFFVAEDFSDLSNVSRKKGQVDVCFVSVRPTESGEIVGGYRCNDVVELMFKVTDGSGRSLIDWYRANLRVLEDAIRQEVDSADFVMMQLDAHEGSLWISLRIRVKSVSDWMKQATDDTLRWVRNNKDGIDTWSRVGSNLSALVWNLVQVFSLFLDGGGSLPGLL